MPTIGQFLNQAHLAKIHLWATDSGAAHDMRVVERNCGVDALFIPVSNEFGIKFFMNHQVAKASFYISRILYHFGCAPKCMDFRTIVNNGRTYYAFLTERCLIMGKDFIGRRKYSKNLERIRRRLRNRIEYTHFYPDDDHEYNVGVNKYGKPVYVDVGYFEVKSGGNYFSTRYLD